MQEKYGDDGFSIYQLPNGKKIQTEAFSEFQKAFSYMIKTQMYQEEIAVTIKNQNGDKPLIITEGATDWRHIKAAMNFLSKQEEHNALFDNMDIDFLEYDPKNSNSESDIKLEMGNSTLCSMCKEYAKIKQSRKMIFIADRDDPNTNKILGDNEMFKNWGNNVYSILLPIPPHRDSTPNICVEHYYTDEEIKTNVVINSITRRLYMGNEFDSHGRGLKDQIICEKPKVCGEGKINIIEGSNGEKVISNQPNSDDNLALPKMEFANRILKNEAPFDKINFDAFIELFRIINEIIKLS